LRLEPPEELKVIRVPASDMGGREGKVLRMAASRVLNNLIDRYDNERRRYDVRATVETLHVEDANPFDNSKTKSWNVPHAVRPGQRNTFNYVFQNHESSPVPGFGCLSGRLTPKAGILRACQAVPTRSPSSRTRRSAAFCGWTLQQP